MSPSLQGRPAPRWIRHLLLRRYGRHLFGGPRYRLVWSASRFEPSAGLWTDWSEATAIADRDSGAAQPLRRIPELRWVPKYPGLHCWLIECWLPPSRFGTPAFWYSPLASGGTMITAGGCKLPACGPYPSAGDYEDIGARMFWYPSERHLTLAIDAHLHSLARRPASPRARALRRTFLAQQAQQRRDREYDAFCADVLSDADQAFHGAPHIGYGGAHRHSSVELCDRLGIASHPF